MMNCLGLLNDSEWTRAGLKCLTQVHFLSIRPQTSCFHIIQRNYASFKNSGLEKIGEYKSMMLDNVILIFVQGKHF